MKRDRVLGEVDSSDIRSKARRGTRNSQGVKPRHKNGGMRENAAEEEGESVARWPGGGRQQGGYKHRTAFIKNEVEWLVKF